MSNEIEKIKIISCIGQRALAVITPIKTLLKIPELKDKEIDVLLIHTVRTKEIGGKCKEWLSRKKIKNRFPKANILSPILFESSKAFVEKMAGDSGIIYFNTNPGMNWEVSFLSLYLPENTICFSSDTKWLYKWNLLKDISLREKIKLDNIELESYLSLSPDIKIKTNKYINNSLSKKVKQYLKKFKRIKSFEGINKIGISDNLLQIINTRLIWVRERNGILHLLFDLHTDKKENEGLLNNFRFITSIFDSINYAVTIVSDRDSIINRAKVECVDSINTDRIKWNTKIENWISGKREVKPKEMVPTDASPENITAEDLKNKQLLCVCLGDNIETTLKAILSHDLDVALFYDAKSPRIRYLADKLITISPFEKKIYLIPTDHRGTGILDTVDKLVQKGNTCIFNITPGTKMQTVELTAAARKNNLVSNVYSIDKECIKSLTNSEDVLAVKSPEIIELINCHIAPFEYDKKMINKHNNPFKLKLWSKLLKKLADGDIKPYGNILELKYRDGQKVFKSKNDKVELEDKEYLIDKVFFTQAGSWWEAVVAKAVSTLNTEVYWQVIWSNEGVKFSELDVVSRFKEHIIVISCKTKPQDIEIVAHLVKSESSKRFGRFAMPFVAVPYDKVNGKNIGGNSVEGVKILTPSLLNNKTKLEGCFTDFLKGLRTTT